MNTNTILNEYRLRLLNQLIEERAGGSVKTFAVLIGMKNANQISNYRARNRNIGDAQARKMEIGLGLERGYFDLPAKGGAKEERVSSVAGSTSNAKAPPDVSGRPIPHFATAPAGPWKELVSENEENEQILSWLPAPPEVCGEHTFAVSVVGESMMSDGILSYPPGSVVYVDPDQADQCQSGDPVLALLDNRQVVFKILMEDAGTRFLQSLHKSYPVITQPFTIMGKVIGSYLSTRKLHK